MRSQPAARPGTTSSSSPCSSLGRWTSVLSRAPLRNTGSASRARWGSRSTTTSTAATPDSVAHGEQLLNDALSAAHDLGSTYLGGVIYDALGPYPDMPTDTGRRNSVDVIRRLAERATASDITLGLECVNRYESNLLNTAAQTIEYVRRGGARQRGGAPGLVPHEHRGANFHDPVFECGDKLGYVHIGENHRGYLGQGHVNFPELFAALAKRRLRRHDHLRVRSPRPSSIPAVAHATHLAQRVDRRDGSRQAARPLHSEQSAVAGNHLTLTAK